MKRCFALFCLMMVTILVPADLSSQIDDTEIFSRLKEADMMARSGKNPEAALKAYVACLEDSHRFELPTVGVVVLNLCMFSETYPPARDTIVKYLRGWVSKAWSGRLSPLQMTPLDAMADLSKREDVLTESFAEVMAAQKTAEQKWAWGKACFKAMLKAKKYAELHRHFDMFGAAQYRLKQWQSKEGSSVRSMAVGIMRSEFNDYLDVYRKADDEDGAAKMTSLICQLEKCAE